MSNNNFEASQEAIAHCAREIMGVKEWPGSAMAGCCGGNCGGQKESESTYNRLHADWVREHHISRLLFLFLRRFFELHRFIRPTAHDEKIIIVLDVCWGSGRYKKGSSIKVRQSSC